MGRHADPTSYLFVRKTQGQERAKPVPGQLTVGRLGHTGLLLGGSIVSAMNHVDSVAAARTLSALLNSTNRTTPVAVVSTPAGRDAPYIDAEELRAEVGDLVPVYLMPTGEVSWAFSEQMADLTQVYGGAGRVYPVGVEWVRDPHESPLRFAFNDTEGKRSTEALINDALSMAAAAGLVGSAVPTTARVVTGQVVGVTAGRGIVRLGSGQFANIVGELTVPGVHTERIVTSGMTVNGTLDIAGRLDIRAIVRPAWALPYAEGDVVLARVNRVDARSAQLALHPQLAVDVPREAVTDNPFDDLDALMSAGEVLRARVESTSPWKLVMRDLEDEEEAAPAFALVDGGPPWVTEGLPDVEPDEEPERPKPTPLPDVAGSSTATPPPPVQPAPKPPTPAIFDRGRMATLPPRTPALEAAPALAPEPAGPKPTVPPAQAAIARQQTELNRVADELRRTQAEVDDLRNEHQLLLGERTKAANRVRHLESELARAKQKLRASGSRPASDRADYGPRFGDPEEQFRHDVYVAWVNRISPDDKQQRPLTTFTLGPSFLDSVAALQGIKRSKIVEIVVEVLTGIANEQTSRQVHRLRTSEAGDTPQRIRHDGATAWRVNLQVNTPGARRLHYWQLPNGTLELSRVVLHDDFHP